MGLGGGCFVNSCTAVCDCASDWLPPGEGGLLLAHAMLLHERHLHHSQCVAAFAGEHQEEHMATLLSLEGSLARETHASPSSSCAKLRLTTATVAATRQAHMVLTGGQTPVSSEGRRARARNCRRTKGK